MYTYFISDLHLHANSKIQTELLLAFLGTQGMQADAIYILGDFFAMWLGDDLNEPYIQTVQRALQDISKQNIPLYFMRGNRDFLISDKFCRASTCNMLPDPCTIELYGQKILLTHGDQLCTLDLEYQKFRKFVQHRFTRKLFLSLPGWLRKKLALWVKGRTRGSPKDPATYDVAQATVDAWFAKHAVNTMIHGHTHRPAIHKHGANTRIVLGDWEPNSAKILAFAADHYQLIDLVKT